MDDDDRRRRFECGLERVYRHPGYGPWDAKLWVCGAEERPPTDTIDDDWVLNEKHPVTQQDPFVPDEQNRTSPAWRRSFELAARMFDPEIKNPWDFGTRWCKQPNLLHLTNVLVVPKRRTRDWSLEMLSREDYAQGIYEVRVPVLRARRCGSVVVCHYTKETRDYGIAAFVRDGDTPERVEASDGRSFAVYRSSQAVLCPFFLGFRMTNPLFAELCKVVRELLATTPCKAQADREASSTTIPVPA